MIFVTKYRKKILTGKVGKDVKQYLFEAAMLSRANIIKMETDEGHVHLLLCYTADQSISMLAKDLKQYSTYKMWQEHNALLREHFWKRKNLWSDGYFACSIGQVSQKIVEQYIQNQG